MSLVDDAMPAGGLTRLAELLADRRPRQGLFLIGVTGAVASGKSTLAGALQETLRSGSASSRVEVVCTDGFLFSNKVLAERGLEAKKGYPESYDLAALRRALSAARRGPVAFPGYSHVTYDVDPLLERIVDAPDILIIEGLGLGLDRSSDGAPSALIDALIYLDADEADLEAWFVGRFLGLWEEAEHDPASFYARFRTLDREGARGLARSVWRGINLPNLRQHIAPLRHLADIVAHKAADHRIDRLSTRQSRRPDARA